MRHLFTKLGSLAAVAMLACTVAQPAQAEQHSTGTARAAAQGPAYFEMREGTGEHHTFILKIEDEQKIQHARDLVSGATRDEPHVVGRLRKQRAEYNRDWSFHYIPETISFFNYAPEFCDAELRYVEDHLDEVGGAFLPSLHYCPWRSQLVREVPAP
ncbi:calmodulin-binding protein [Streptomyces sp. NPDC048442]|uniref:BP74-related protein n=1 Tax=Streptomyces sp. NPDC048442 TaxID=3154823 RepID=UPI00342A9147